MRSGLETTSNRNYGSWVASSNWVRDALERPLVRDPGARMVYSTGNTHLLSAILTKVAGNTWKFADEALARPLGFDLPRWPTDPQGIYFGGNDMELTPRQMLAFGEMYLNGGRYGDKRVISEAWVRESLTPRTRSWRDTRRLYGYCWWIRDLGGFRTFYAWGYGGQFIFVVPDLDLVAVTTSSTAPGGDRRDHLGGIYDLVEDQIIRPVAAAGQSIAD
jgi:CubicO group peptidase (beta-lactamase class C family)